MRQAITALFFITSIFATSIYAAPSQIEPLGERAVIVDPRTHVWAAYSADGNLVKSGLASAGANWCPDIKRPCRTRSGVFRVYYMGDESCYSTRYPLPDGGAPMPYCMYFNGNQALHGSPHLAHANISHGCVRMRTSDARWLSQNFVNEGTLVVVKSY